MRQEEEKQWKQYKCKAYFHQAKIQFLAAFLIVTMLVPLLPNPKYMAAAATNFTYEYQQGGSVEALNMSIGEEVDLKFIGVKDYKTLKLKWISTNEEVAVVDNKGVVTAMSNGEAEVYLQVGNGAFYTSKRIPVKVGAIVNVLLGKSKKNTFQNYTLQLGKQVDLNFYGVTDWSNNKYTTAWNSSNTSVATVDRKGVVTALRTGETRISLTITNTSTGAELNVIPVDITVIDASATPSVTATPTPAYGVTPAVSPSVTPSPSPSPIPAYNPYVAKQLSDTEIQLTFTYDVSYTFADFSLTCLYASYYELAVPMEQVTVKGNIVILKVGTSFQNGEQYTIHVTGETSGTKLVTRIGNVDSLVVTYSSMGKQGVAYTNGEYGDVIDIQLNTKLMSSGIDVTNLYGDSSVTYTLATENTYVYLDNYHGTLNIYRAGIAVTVYVSYIYYDNYGRAHEIKSVVSMVSSQAPAYLITEVVDWTIVPSTAATIDWTKPNHTIAAYDEGFSLVLLIADSYGNTFITNEKFATTEYLAIPGSVLESKGFSVEFSCSDYGKLSIGSDGMLTAYNSGSVNAFVLSYQPNAATGLEPVRTVAALPIVITAERTVSKLVLTKPLLELVTDGDYTTSATTLKVYDQYGDEWTKNDLYFAITSAPDGVTPVEDVIYSKTEKSATISLDGRVIYALTNGKVAASLTLMEPLSKKSVTLRIQLRRPRYDTNGLIQVTGYQLAAEDVDQYKDVTATDGYYESSAAIMFYQLSNTCRVGAASDYSLISKASQLKIKQANTTIGSRYLAVYAPDGSMVPVSDGTELGVVRTANGCKLVVAREDSSHCMKYLNTGAYIVKLFEVTGFNNSGYAVLKQKYTDTLLVTSTAKSVAFQLQKSMESMSYTIEDIVRDSFTFTLGGETWVPSDSQIKNVAVKKLSTSSYLIITSITFQLPVTDSNDVTYYEQTVTLNKSVRAAYY